MIGYWMLLQKVSIWLALIELNSYETLTEQDTVLRMLKSAEEKSMKSVCKPTIIITVSLLNFLGHTQEFTA